MIFLYSVLGICRLSMAFCTCSFVSRSNISEREKQKGHIQIQPPVRGAMRLHGRHASDSYTSSAGDRHCFYLTDQDTETFNPLLRPHNNEGEAWSPARSWGSGRPFPLGPAPLPHRFLLSVAFLPTRISLGMVYLKTACWAGETKIVYLLGHAVLQSQGPQFPREERREAAL